MGKKFIYQEVIKLITKVWEMDKNKDNQRIYEIYDTYVSDLITIHYILK